MDLPDYTINTCFHSVDNIVNKYVASINEITPTYLWDIRNSMISEGLIHCTFCFSEDLVKLVRPVLWPKTNEDVLSNQNGIFKNLIDSHKSQFVVENYLGNILGSNIYSTDKLNSAILFIVHDKNFTNFKTRLKIFKS